MAVLGRVPGTSGQWGDLERHPENEPAPGVVVLRVGERALLRERRCACGDEIRARAAEGARAVVLDAASVPAIDVTAVTMLVELAEELARDGVELVLARDIAAVRDLVRLAKARRCFGASRPCRPRSTS